MIPEVKIGQIVLYRVARTGSHVQEDWGLRYNYSNRTDELVWRPAIVLRIWGDGQWLNLRVLADGPQKLDVWRCSIQHWSAAEELQNAWAAPDEDPGPYTGEHPKMVNTDNPYVGRTQDTSVV